MKKIIFLITVIFSVTIICGLIGSIYQLWHKQDVLYRTAHQLVLVQKQNQQLKNQLTIVKTKQFVEEQARDNLFLVKPNEHDVIIAKNLTDNKQKMIIQKVNLPYWKQWLAIFF